MGKNLKFSISILLPTYTYRALQVRLEACMSSCGEYHHGNASLNLLTAAQNPIKVLHNLVRRPHLQTQSFPIPYFH